MLERYWLPLYAHARQRGLKAEDAEDATQEFLTKLLSGDLLLQADPARGRFRTFLLSIWRNFLIDQYRRQQASFRGGKARFESLDWAAGESTWQRQKACLADASERQPDDAFMISWAHGLLDASREQLRADYAGRGRGHYYHTLLPFLTQTMDADACNQVAATIGLTTSAAKVALHRLRQRFAAKLRQLVADTLEDPADVEAELGELLSLLSR